MVSTTLSLIAFFALIAWRFVFTGLRRRPLAREIAAPQQQHTSVLELVHPFTPEDRAETYLHRIVALTAATQMGKGYVLDVGTTRFHVRDGYVRRIRDVTDPKCAYEETCFYSAHKEMPKSEHMATALLQLKNKPALFERWAARSGAFKADGQAFSPAQ